MRRETLWQSRLPTPLPKLVGEARRCEGLAVIRHQESQMLALRNRQALMQFVVNWNCDLDARLLLLNCHWDRVTTVSPNVASGYLDRMSP
jgi:hypothetical protein